MAWGVQSFEKWNKNGRKYWVNFVVNILYSKTGQDKNKEKDLLPISVIKMRYDDKFYICFKNCRIL